MEYKTVQDTIHGSVKFYGPFLELLECPEIQRLHNIKQLGLTKLVFPGANHTRLEHSIGSYRVAEKMSENLGLEKERKEMIMAAALLHDVGHAPFSHTLETVLADATGKDHMDITKEFITGERFIKKRDTPLIPEIMKDHGISPEKVADLIKGRGKEVTVPDFDEQEGQSYFDKERYHYQMIHGPLDVDQLDYLLRDSHYTGALHGIIDIERLLQTVEIQTGKLVISKGGVPAVEGMLVARNLMFSSVYLHKTARIAELMLTKAIRELKDDLERIYTMTDCELFSLLRERGGFQKEIVNRLKYRRLYKRCFSLSPEELKKAEGVDPDRIGKLKEMRVLEKVLANKMNVSPHKVIVDVPHRELKLSEPRLSRTNIKVLDDNRLYSLSRFSPLARALKKRPTQSWALMVSCPETMRDELSTIAERVIVGE